MIRGKGEREEEEGGGGGKSQGRGKKEKYKMSNNITIIWLLSGNNGRHGMIFSKCWKKIIIKP